MNDFMRTILFLPEQRSTVAYELDLLHYFVIGVTMLGAFGVALLAAFYLWRYRKSARRGGYKEPDRDPLHSPGGIPFWVEIGLIGGLLTLFLVWWVIGFRQFVRLQTPPEDAVEVYVVGKKWMWSFSYPDGGGSNVRLYVPVDRPVKLVMTSRDVIHSFFVPDFRIKQDVVPGRLTTVWFEVTEPGTYPILCTEYCGAGHSTMRGQVIALADVDYEQQMEGTQRLDIAGPGYAEPAVTGGDLPGESLSMVEMGERVAAEKGCLRCHTIDGTPHIGPTWARAYGAPVVLDTGEVIVADDAYLTESMMDPLVKLHRGYAPVMPSYQGLLTAGETGALVEYIKSLRTVAVDTPVSPLPLAPGPGPTEVEIPAAGPVGVPERMEQTAPVEPMDSPRPRPDEPPYEPPGTGEQVEGQPELEEVE